ncbi:hypothetical protein F4779DRAFT_626892 [Xylariaceae sp. FL0662B]|nr:hypothetical protein F4779DRAFT_626892 [Xylariaceae sp. FL0662B]
MSPVIQLLTPCHAIFGPPPTPSTSGCRGEDSRAVKVANLDFEARIPVPFSIFPRTYKEAEVETTTQQTHEELEINLPAKSEKPGREGQYSSVSASAQLPPRPEQRFSEEEVRITREEERYRRPGAHREYYEEHRPHTSFHHKHHHHKPTYSSYAETEVEVDRKHQHYYSPLDKIEREYRARAQPNYKDDLDVTETTVDVPPPRPSRHEHSDVTEITIDPPSFRPVRREQVHISETTVDAAKPAPSYHKDTKVREETVRYPQKHSPATQKSRMGYYDEDGHYHSFRHGLHKMADRVFHPEGVEHVKVHESHSARPSSSRSKSITPNTVTIPCHHVRMGDILMLQGRPCQVIRISTSSATGQHRYLGVDLFTKQLHEESSFISNPAPSVVVQTMLGPVFKQYRVLDLQDGTVVAMTETGDVKTGLPVAEQSNLWERLQRAFDQGHGSVRVLVLSDGGQELAVDVKVIHGSRL